MKLASAILAFGLITCVLSQQCNNPLLAAYNLTALDQPQSGAGFPWCSNLQNGQSCCSSDTVSQFQGLLQGLINSIEEEAGARDRASLDLRNTVLDSYQNDVSDLTDNDDELRNINTANPAVGEEIRSEWSRFRNVSDLLSDLDDDDDNDRDDDDTDSDDDNDFFVYLQNLQAARATCLKKVLEVQTSLWCLACDANWASQGVTENGTVTLSDALANDISDNCYNYTVWSQRFNPLFIANQTIQRVRDLNAYLRRYRNDNNVLQNENVTGGVYESSNATERTVTLPPQCTNTSCLWQSLLLLPGAAVSQEVAANGAGWIGGADASLPNIIQGTVEPLAEPVEEDRFASDNGIQVLVQNGSNSTGWSPVANLSGLPVDVAGDPAQVTGLDDGVVAGNAGAGAATGAVGGAAAGGAATGALTDRTDNDGVNTDLTDNDGINTDNTDNDGVNTDVNDPTDNDPTDSDN